MNAFDKVIGYSNEKEEMLMLCDVLKNKEKYTNFGVKIPEAVLLYGKPGLGKTLMAKAFIKETGRKVFLCQKDKPNGQFVDKIRATFEDAIKEARPSSSLTIWISLPKTIYSKTATKKNLSQFRQDWKKLTIKTYLLLQLQTT